MLRMKELKKAEIKSVIKALSEIQSRVYHLLASLQWILEEQE